MIKVLTDWIAGTPLVDRPGLYLTRHDDMMLTVMKRWDGRAWTYYNGARIEKEWWPTHFRGLAFDPGAAEQTECLETGVMGWFVPGNGPSRQPWLQRTR